MSTSFLDLLIDFILPSGTNILEVFFSVSIVLVLLFSIIFSFGLSSSQGLKKWQRNLDNLLESKNVDELMSIDSGDLKEDIATPIEKVLSITPSLLLVFGLLGTFIGIGLALNNASHILQTAGDVGTSGVGENVIDQIGGLLSGLGAKFKTSTWAIMSYIFLNIWFTTFANYESKRSNFVIRTVKALKVNAQQKLNNETKSHYQNLYQKFDENNLLARQIVEYGEKTISIMGADLTKICNALLVTNDVSKKTNSSLEDLNDKISFEASTNRDILTTHFTTHNNKLEELFREQTDKFELSTKPLFQELETLNHQIGQSNASLTSMGANINTLGEAGDKMTNAAQLFSEQASHLDSSISSFSEKTEQTLNQIQDSIKGSINELSSNMEKVNQELNNSINSMDNSINQSIESISSNLNSSISDMSNNMQQVNKDLKNTIDTMDSSIKTTMEKIARDLGASTDTMASSLSLATTEMNKTIEQLPAITKELFDNIKSTIESMQKKSDEMNKNFEIHMDSASKKINENLTSFDLNIKSMTDSITEQLKSVSTVNLQIKTTLHGIKNSFSESGFMKASPEDVQIIIDYCKSLPTNSPEQTNTAP